jgi:hypothetical protein
MALTCRLRFDDGDGAAVIPEPHDFLLPAFHCKKGNK